MSLTDSRLSLYSAGNFSFAHSLLLFDPPVVSPHLVLATSYDTLVAAQEKYPDLMEHVDAIKAAGIRVMFGVDCTNLSKYREIKDGSGNGWDKVGFNFPHVGASSSSPSKSQSLTSLLNQDLELRIRTATLFVHCPSAHPPRNANAALSVPTKL